MKSDQRNVDDILQRSLPSAPREQMEAALDRVFTRLQSDRGWTVSEPIVPADVRRGLGWWWGPAMAITAATILIAASMWTSVPVGDRGVFAVLETGDSAYRIDDVRRVPIRAGERIRAQERIQADGKGGAMLALADGSRVEMRSRSELSWERADDGLTIRLGAGSIIVNAAKQPNGHLYVQTKDITVAVVGTVFLVNAQEDGSRVGVIEGEVRVRERTVETRLRPGEQVSTSPTLATHPLKEDIAWSRNADAHLAILATFEKGMAISAGPRTPLANTSAAGQGVARQSDAAAPAGPTFEEASVRPCDPDNIPAAPEGARGGGPNSFQMTPGRTHVLCMTLATIIRTAYGYGPADLDFLNGGGIGPGRRGLSFNNVYGLGVEDGVRVRGGPDWLRSERYTIDAVADGAADADTMRGAMLRALLERRFQLKAHVETEQVPAFNLTVAKGGLKIKPVDTDAVDTSGFVNTKKDGGACEPLPPLTPGQPRILRPRSFVDIRRGEKPNCGLNIQVNGPNQVIVGGGVTLTAIARAIGGPLGNVPVYDKTGVTDKFNFVLEFVWDENTPGRRILVPQPGEASDAPRAATIFTALEEQLGLKLEPAKAPREFLVIDRIERPTPN
jgi:uncharacterized protein (TIGR03435 family)